MIYENYMEVKQWYKWLLYTTVFMLVFTSKETLLFGTNSDVLIKYYGYVTPVFFLVCWGSEWFWNKHIDKRRVLYCVVFSVLIIFSTLTNLEISFKYAYEIILLWLGFFLAECIDLDSIVKAFTNIILFLSICSLLAWALILVWGMDIFKFSLKYSNTSGLFFYNLILAQVPLSEAIKSRNFGIFREPGVYAIFLILALVLELCKKEKIKLYKIAIFILAIFSTGSTAGILVAAMVVLGFFALSDNNVGVKKIKSILFFSLIAGILIFISFFDYASILGSVFNKLFVENASLSSRRDSFVLNLILIAQRPWSIFFGGGFEYVESEFANIAQIYSLPSTNNTNTLFKIFSVNGLFFTALFIYGSTCAIIKKKKTDWIYYACAFTLMLFNEEIIMNVLIYFILFASVRNCYGKKNEENIYDKLRALWEYGENNVRYSKRSEG